MNPLGSNFQTFLFDMDGVILDSEPIHQQAAQQAIIKADLKIDFNFLYTQFKAYPDQQLFTHMLAAVDQMDPELVAYLVQAKAEVFQQLLPQAPLIPGVLDFIQQARQTYGSLALVTSSTRFDQQRIFEMNGLTPWFDVVVTANDVSHFKPDPDPYLQALQKLQADPRRCLVFEDTTHGIQAAVKAGCRAIGITSSLAAAILIEAGAEAAFSDFWQVKAWLDPTSHCF